MTSLASNPMHGVIPANYDTFISATTTSSRPQTITFTLGASYHLRGFSSTGSNVKLTVDDGPLGKGATSLPLGLTNFGRSWNVTWEYTDKNNILQKTTIMNPVPSKQPWGTAGTQYTWTWGSTWYDSDPADSWLIMDCYVLGSGEASDSKEGERVDGTNDTKDGHQNGI